MGGRKIPVSRRDAAVLVAALDLVAHEQPIVRTIREAAASLSEEEDVLVGREDAPFVLAALNMLVDANPRAVAECLLDLRYELVIRSEAGRR